MKLPLITAALTLMTTAAIANHSEEQCVAAANGIYSGASARDLGVEPSVIVSGLINSGASVEIAVYIVELILGSPGIEPTAIADAYFDYCMSEDA